MTDTAAPIYPQHDIAKSREIEMRVAGAFLDFLDEQELTLCIYDKQRWSQDGEYLATRKSKEQIIAEFLGIDLRAFNDEKDRMLEEMTA